MLENIAKVSKRTKKHEKSQKCLKLTYLRIYARTRAHTYVRARVLRLFTVFLRLLVCFRGVFKTFAMFLTYF